MELSIRNFVKFFLLSYLVLAPITAVAANHKTAEIFPLVFGVQYTDGQSSIKLRGDDVIISDLNGEVTRGKFVEHLNLPIQLPMEFFSSIPNLVNADMKQLVGTIHGKAGTQNVTGHKVAITVKVGEDVVTFEAFTILDLGLPLSELKAKARNFEFINRSYRKGKSTLPFSQSKNRYERFGILTPAAHLSPAPSCLTCFTNFEGNLSFCQAVYSACYGGAVAAGLLAFSSCSFAPGICLAIADLTFQAVAAGCTFGIFNCLASANNTYSACLINCDSEGGNEGGGGQPL